jgi:beta-glucosidase
MTTISDRRSFLAGAAALASVPATASAQSRSAELKPFPRDFIWATATAGHQVEGNNTNSDSWLLENVKPTVYGEPSLDACNSFALWATDLDLVRRLNLGAYRFSLEWSRIEPAKGRFSTAMLNHYKAVIEGCRARGIIPMVTFNHFTVPQWFAAQGGWTNPESSDLFSRFCDKAIRHLGAGIGFATTLNEPNLTFTIAAAVPEVAAPLIKLIEAMSDAAGKALGSDRFRLSYLMPLDVAKASLPNMIAAHRKGRAAIKAVRPDLPVGVSLSMGDEQGAVARRDQVRTSAYGAWLEAARGDDFIGVQNYGRNVWGADGKKLPPPANAKRGMNGDEVFAPSLAGAVRYAHAASGCPVFVTEHGVGTDDDTIRAALIPAALRELRIAMDEGVPVLGYTHWTLLDNFEWIYGYKMRFGLCAVDRTTFKRTPKPSAVVLSAIAKRNAV